MDFVQAAILGVAQGVAEWIPISSEGITVLLGAVFFRGVTITELVHFSLFLHLGTFLAALAYFYKDVWELLRGTLFYRRADKATKKLINFYITTTVVSGVVGMLVLRAMRGLEDWISPTTRGVLVVLGGMLLITGVVQLRRRTNGERTAADVGLTDGIVAGIAQGISVIPGISRSGMTVATLLLRGVDDKPSLKLSFIMSLPVVLAGNVVLNTSEFVLTIQSLVSLVLAFIFGLLVIRYLLKAAERLRFGWFMLLFGGLVIASAFLTG